MKKLLMVFLIATLTLSLISCEKDKVSKNMMSSKAINKTMYQDCKNDHYPKKESMTAPSYKLLIDGKVDLIIVPYAPSDVLNLAEKTQRNYI